MLRPLYSREGIHIPIEQETMVWMMWLAAFFTFISLYIPARVLLLPDVLSNLTEADRGSKYLFQQKRSGKHNSM